MLSVVYPVRLYACSTACGWIGLLSSSSGQQRRKRQLRTALGIVVVSLVAGLVLWRFRNDLVWSPAQPVHDDIVEESSGAP